MSSVNLLVFFFFLLPACYMTAAKVVLIGSHVNLSFDDIEAIFAPKIKGSGESGVLYLAEPLDACRALTNRAEQLSNVSAPFVLIVRGRCSFEEKVTRAQKAGFKAAIVYDNEDGFLVAMAGNSAGINIHAVFVTKASGELLMEYAGLTSLQLLIIPSFESSAWSIMSISFMSLLAMSTVLATCFFVRRRHVRGERPRASSVCEFHGMSSHLVKAMPSVIFTTVSEDNCTSRACAICLEDYSIGEKLRILPCHHMFHATCVDTWLTTWRTFCPVCKRDAKTRVLDPPPPSESTPLLSVASSILSSVRSSLASSSSIRNVHATSWSLFVSRNHSLASTPPVQPSLIPYYQSSPLTISRSSVDLRNASQRSLTPHSRDCQSLLSLNSTTHIPSLTHASARFIGSFSNWQRHPLHHSECTAMFPPFASGQSLPECETV